MTCPDNLLIGYRRGALGDEERARLDAHLVGCPTCRLTLRVGSDFDQVLETVPGDDLIAARFAHNLAPKLERDRTQRRGAAWRYAWVAAATLAIIASGGLAAARLGGAWPFARREPPPARVVEQPARAARPIAKPAPVLAPAPVEPSVETPADEAPRAERAPGAAELFAQANTLRRNGESGRARSLYRQLQQRYPRSAEVEVSHVSLGRVLLELGDARAALEQFERYLSKQPRGPLAEEALFGQASALERLGRGAAERRTWNALLDAYPRSVYADRARERLESMP